MTSCMSLAAIGGGGEFSFDDFFGDDDEEEDADADPAPHKKEEEEQEDKEGKQDKQDKDTAERKPSLLAATTSLSPSLPLSPCRSPTTAPCSPSKAAASASRGGKRSYADYSSSSDGEEDESDCERETESETEKDVVVTLSTSPSHTSLLHTTHTHKAARESSLSHSLSLPAAPPSLFETLRDRAPLAPRSLSHTSVCVRHTSLAELHTRLRDALSRCEGVRVERHFFSYHLLCERHSEENNSNNNNNNVSAALCVLRVNVYSAAADEESDGSDSFVVEVVRERGERAVWFEVYGEIKRALLYEHVERERDVLSGLTQMLSQRAAQRDVLDNEREELFLERTASPPIAV